MKAERLTDQKRGFRHRLWSCREQTPVWRALQTAATERMRADTVTGFDRGAAFSLAFWPSSLPAFASSTEPRDRRGFGRTQNRDRPRPVGGHEILDALLDHAAMRPRRVTGEKLCRLDRMR